MAVDLDDIMQGVENHLTTALASISDISIVPGLPDDRVETREDAPDKEVCFSIYDFLPAPDEDYSGKFYVDAINKGSGIATRVRKPHPYRLYISVDTYCRRKIENRKIMLLLEALFVSEKDINTPGGDSYWPRQELGDNQDDMLEGQSHRVQRFSIPLWLPDAHAAQEVALVLAAQFNVNTTDLSIQVEQ